MILHAWYICTSLSNSLITITNSKILHNIIKTFISKTNHIRCSIKLYCLMMLVVTILEYIAMTFNPVFLYHLLLIFFFSFQVWEEVRSVGMNFSFPINKGRFLEKIRPKRMARNWTRRREEESVWRIQKSWGNVPNPSFYPPSNHIVQTVKDWTRFSHWPGDEILLFPLSTRPEIHSPWSHTDPTCYLLYPAWFVNTDSGMEVRGPSMLFPKGKLFLYNTKQMSAGARDGCSK